MLAQTSGSRLLSIQLKTTARFREPTWSLLTTLHRYVADNCDIEEMGAQSFSIHLLSIICRLHVMSKCCCAVQLAHPLLKAAGKSSIVMIGSVAGGPSTVQSGTIYAMLKGVSFDSSCCLWCPYACIAATQGAKRCA